MFRNLYDSDITTWSPQGRLHQVEYAMEAVKQGSAAVGLKSDTHVVLCALKRSSNDLAKPQEKVFKVDEHMGIAIAGLTADARVLCKYMRKECMSHRFVFSSAMQTQRLVLQLCDKAQKSTQHYGRRPYGVGLLVAGYDKTGAHLFQTDPSGNYFDYKAISIGARSQSAKTYLERSFTSFAGLDKAALIKHGLKALKETAPQGLTPSAGNTTVAVVGKDTPWTFLSDAELSAVYSSLDSGAAPMQT